MAITKEQARKSANEFQIGCASSSRYTGVPGVAPSNSTIYPLAMANEAIRHAKRIIGARAAIIRYHAKRTL